MHHGAFRREDRIGLVAALAIHVVLIAGLALQFLFAPVDRPMPQRMTVSLATEVGLEATAPDPVPESRAAIAPTLSDDPAPQVQDEPAETSPDTPPLPRARPEPRPARPAPPDTRERRRPEQARAEPEPPRASERTGGSRIGENFLEGQGSSTRTEETRAPAATFGRSERAALSSAITRQLRPHWNAPTGADAEKLVSIVSWKLNRDGSLNGRPSCRNEAGSITDSNKPQAGLHCERAIRAVQLAAPFNLPEQFYNRWNDLEWQFDRRL